MRENDGRWLAAELIKSGRTGARAMEDCGGRGSADDEEAWREMGGGLARVSLPRRVFPERVWCCKGAPRDGIPCHTIVEAASSIISPEILPPFPLVAACGWERRSRLSSVFLGNLSVSPHSVPEGFSIFSPFLSTDRFLSAMLLIFVSSTPPSLTSRY